ncbi:hypothetical protein L6164_006915 [Bauhinia variegata]|uniref:Uncharacterized protein n=1 Tax=Bauhinia variegata TaxID=167791 RepID=A0ACB9PVX0_BAUVA|nr:hypothetical protein L6164_006915 [Bauhinia variegata]
MGDASETMRMKKKKKGRPSLLDLQKRSLKNQQQQQKERQKQNLTNTYSNQNRRPTRRNPVPDFTHSAPNGTDGDGNNGDDDDERKQKKHKLLVGLNSHRHHTTLSPDPLAADSNNDDGDDPDATRKRRKINVVYEGSNQTSKKVLKATESKHGSQEESGPTTPLPDKKLLLFILDRLQKKDSHGVFSEPVDPEELPDYHDIIARPMDFGTLRKKLDAGVYNNLEQFEKDVLLICSNAMQYNAPDTIYYRQARSMQEMAQKDFANLRQDSDDSEPQQKIVRRGRPPGKSTRKSMGMSPSEHVGPESSSDATLASAGDNACGSNVYNLRKGINKFHPAESSARASQNNFTNGSYTGWLSEWENEFPASVLKAVLRYGKKQLMVDETRRDTYIYPVASGNEPPASIPVDEEFKQLLAVGLHVKHSYARSLACFAADLGPVVWNIAARKIRSVLPAGHGFGRGWVSDDEESQKRHKPFCGEEGSVDPRLPDDYTNRFSSSGSFPVANRSSLQSGEVVLNSQSELNSLDSVGRGIESVTPLRIQQEPTVHSNDAYGSDGRLAPNFSSQMRMVKLSDLTGTPSSSDQMLDTDRVNNSGTFLAPSNMNPPPKAQLLNNLSQSGSELQTYSQGLTGKSSWQGLAVPTKQNALSFPNCLNGEVGATNSSSSNAATLSQLQPNLALQL